MLSRILFENWGKFQITLQFPFFFFFLFLSSHYSCKSLYYCYCSLKCSYFVHVGSAVCPTGREVHVIVCHVLKTTEMLLLGPVEEQLAWGWPSDSTAVLRFTLQYSYRHKKYSLIHVWMKFLLFWCIVVWDPCLLKQLATESVFSIIILASFRQRDNAEEKIRTSFLAQAELPN